MKRLTRLAQLPRASALLMLILTNLSYGQEDGIEAPESETLSDSQGIQILLFGVWTY